MPTRQAPGPRGREAFRWAKRIRTLGILRAINDLQARYGDWVEIKIPFGPKLCFLFAPGDVMQVLQRDAKKFIKGKAADPFKLLIGNGLSVSEGTTWLNQRRLAQPAFHLKSLETYGPTMASVARAHRLQWTGEIDLNKALSKLTHDIVARALLGASLGDRLEPLQMAWQTALSFIVQRANSLIKLPLWLPLPSHLKFHRAIGFVNQTVDEIIIRETRTGGENSKGTLLGRFLAARRGEGGADEAQLAATLSDRDIRDQVLNFLFAGHETTANAMAWSIYLLLRDPSAGDDVQRELEHALAGRPVSWDDLEHLPRLRAAVYESLRLYPPVSMFVREALEPVDLEHGRVEAGAIVILSPFAMHRREELWPSADTFKPERFLDPSKRPTAPAFLAFGAGGRSCVGDHFAVKEMILVLAELLQNVRFTLVEREPVEMFFNGTLRPAPLTVSVSERFQ